MGDGPERPAAERLARKKGISDRILFMGKVDDVHDKLGMADLMLLPSELESFGLAALEAMACEVPTIATNVGGLPEVIDDGKTGFLAPVGDVEAMSKFAIEILSDEKRLREMSSLPDTRRRRDSAPRRSFRNTRISTAKSWNVLRESPNRPTAVRCLTFPPNRADAK